jgi:C1A family cysteine protease
MKLAEIPRVVDLRPWQGPIKDQGDEGSCTGHAGSSDVELIFRKYRNEAPILSPGFVYAQELIAEGTFPEDDGAMPRTICQVLSEFGVAEASVDPYIPGQISKPSADAVKNALLYKLGGYHRLAGLPDVLSCLGNETPWPVLVGFAVYESFESDEVANTGVMPVPNVNKEEFLGGHEVLAIGYDSSKHALLCQNSWGDSWGERGHFWMPYAAVADQNICSDLWIIHLGYWGKA